MQPGPGAARRRGWGGDDAPGRGRLGERALSGTLSERRPAAGERRVPQPLWAAPPPRPGFLGDETRQRLPRRRQQEGGGHGAHLPPQHGHVQPPPPAGHQLHSGGRAPAGGPAPLAVRLAAASLRRRLFLCGGRDSRAAPPSGRDFQEGAGWGFPFLFLAEEPLGLPPVAGEHQAGETQRGGTAAALWGAVRRGWGGEAPSPGQWQRGRSQPECDSGPQPPPPPAPPSPPGPITERQERGHPWGLR